MFIRLSTDLVVMVGDLHSRDHEFEVPMDHFEHLFVVKLFLEKIKNQLKRGPGWPHHFLSKYGQWCF